MVVVIRAAPLVVGVVLPVSREILQVPQQQRTLVQVLAVSGQKMAVAVQVLAVQVP